MYCAAVWQLTKRQTQTNCNRNGTLAHEEFRRQMGVSRRIIYDIEKDRIHLQFQLWFAWYFGKFVKRRYFVFLILFQSFVADIQPILYGTMLTTPPMMELMLNWCEKKIHWLMHIFHNSNFTNL